MFLAFCFVHFFCRRHHRCCLLSLFVVVIIIIIIIKCLAILFIKGYVEIYLGKMQKEEVSYKNVPQCTHAVMLLIVISSVAFHISLWPVYHSKSMLLMFLVGCFIFNFCLLIPTYIQNIVGFITLTFFLQQYK